LLYGLNDDRTRTWLSTANIVVFLAQQRIEHVS
jgi:hypothetical protein